MPKPWCCPFDSRISYDNQFTLIYLKLIIIIGNKLTWNSQRLTVSCFGYESDEKVIFRKLGEWCHLCKKSKIVDNYWYHACAIDCYTALFFIQSEFKPKPIMTRSARIFPLFPSAASQNIEFWLVQCILSVPCDWLQWLRWFPHNIRATMAKIKLPNNLRSMVIFWIKVRRSYQDLSSQADPARENWTWSYTYFT